MRISQFGIFFVIVFGFVPNAFADPELGLHKLAIMNGQVASDSEYSAVVSLAIESGDMLYSYCSGVLIRNNVVLTAAHCMENEDGFDFEQFYRAGKIRVAMGTHIDSRFNTSSYGITHIVAHPEYYQNHHDLALVFLDSEVPITEAEPIDVYMDKTRLRSFAMNRQSVDFVGYGMDEDDNGGNRQKVGGEISAYCPNAVNDCGVTVASKEYVSFFPGTILHEIQSGGPCRGDSGAPVILRNNTGLHVIGIVSYGDAECKLYSVSVSVPDHLDWIQREMNDEEREEGVGCSSLPLRDRWNLSAFILLILLCGLSFFRKKNQLSIANNCH